MKRRRVSSRLLLKAMQAHCVLSKGFGEYFQRDIASETCITGAIDLTHSAGAQQRDDFVRLEFYPRGESHRRAQL